MTTEKRNVFILCLCLAISMSGASLLVAISALAAASIAQEDIVYSLPLIGEFLPEIRQSSLTTIAISLQFLGSMVAAQPSALAARRFGRRPTFIVGQLIGISGALVCAAALFLPSFLLLACGGFLIGTANAFWMQYRFAAADTASPAFRDTAISLVMAGPVLAAFVGPTLARESLSLSPDTPFLGSYFVLAGLGVLAILFLLPLNIPKPEKIIPEKQATRTEERPLFDILQSWPIITAMVVAAVGYAVMSLVMSVTPLSMKFHGFSFSDSAFVIQFHVLAMFAPSFITGWLIKKCSAPVIMLAGIALEFAAVMVNLSGLGFQHFLAGLILLGFGWNFSFIGATSLLTQSHAPADKERVQGFNDMVLFLLVAIASLTAGILEQNFGWATVNLTALPALAIAALLIMLLIGKNWHAQQRIATQTV